MDEETFLLQKLEKISLLLNRNYKDETSLGILAGVSGMAVFQFYYSKYLNKDQYSDIGAEMITYCIEKINDGYSYPTFCNGIAGLGWGIQHLEANDFIDVECDELLPQFDVYLYNQMINDLGKGNYDFLHGALGYGFYFLSRYEHTSNPNLKNIYQSYLSELVAELEKLSISDGLALKWYSPLDFERGNKSFNLSLSHGISSILNFTTRLYKFDVFKESTHRLIIGSANYILGFEDKNCKYSSLFPDVIAENIQLKYNGRIAWCYGDLGVGISLFHAAQALGDNLMKNRALEILGYTTTRKSSDDTLVIDAGICHGSYGNALIYQKLWQNSGNDIFKESLDFWIEDGIQKAVHKDSFTGYKQWNGIQKDWLSELSLLRGVTGIGLVIIDYLSKEPNNWDECLMIS